MDIDALQILHEDNHLLAVCKPAGLLVQGDRSGDESLLDVARAWLKRKYAKPGNVYVGLVHRLDRPVSGVVLLAKTSKAAGRLSKQFRERLVEKSYLAVIDGLPDPTTGELRAWLASEGDAQGRTRASRRPFSGAREAALSYRVVRTAGAASLVEVRPATGRRHQIRAQLALAGYPIRGDRKYGARDPLPDRSIALHARRLTVAHPIGGAPLVLTAPLPVSWPARLRDGEE